MHTALGQSATKQMVFTENIDRFWVAYDSIRTTTDRAKQHVSAIRAAESNEKVMLVFFTHSR
ncbi:hypothetical protein [Hymenobacter gelipurpurascens]|nr:hypothetical protein [Hymenobacter gelipurpurascens]